MAVSLPAAQPNWLGMLRRVERLTMTIVLTPGDGQSLDSGGNQLRQEGEPGLVKAGYADSEAKHPECGPDKAKAAEIASRPRKSRPRNEKAVKINEIVGRTFEAGNTALLAKNYDEAIRQYDEGLAADPEQPGILINEAVAYKARGVQKL